MKSVAIIPARYASTRFPGKPLALIGGKPMIERVYRQVEKATRIDRIVVATDDERIAEVVNNFGGQVMMTSPRHTNGTERCAEVAATLYSDADVIVNIQGDEPFILPEQVDEIIHCFDDPETEIATLVKSTSDPLLINNTGEVKVVLDVNNYALYFSRQTIPFIREVESANWHKHTHYNLHVGIYGYRKEVLGEIVHLPESNLEQLEKLEQLRWLENGYKIKTGFTHHVSLSVETPADLEHAEKYFAANASLFAS